MEFSARPRLPALLALICLLACPALMADTRAEILAVLDYFAESWNEGDLEVLGGYYHTDFRLVTADGIVTREQRLGDIAALGEGGGDRGELSHANVSIIRIEEKHALAYGNRRLHFRDGSSLQTWFSTLYVKTPFGWRALLTHN
jgi:hypothetical protein